MFKFIPFSVHLKRTLDYDYFLKLFSFLFGLVSFFDHYVILFQIYVILLLFVFKVIIFQVTLAISCTSVYFHDKKRS